MDFNDKLQELSKRIEKYKNKVINEEMTKTSFILPFFELLGYDTRNPFEFHAEFTADVADAKGEKVDYAILIDDIPRILIEAKDCNNDLEKSDKQLMRYFNVTEAKIGILTNGIIYKFYADLEQPNIMDSRPFLEVDVTDIKDHEANELKKFFKTNFDINDILDSAEELKYSNLIKKLLASEFESPSDSFITYILGEIYDGVKTQKVKDRFVETIKKSISEFVNELVRTKLESALESNRQEGKTPEPSIENEELDTDPKIETTEEELSGFAAIKALLHDCIDLERLSYKDTHRYFSVLLDDNIRRWICRLYLNGANQYVIFPEINTDGERTGKELKILLPGGVNELYSYKQNFLDVIEKNII